MPYIYSETKAGRTILVQKYFSSRYKKTGLQRSENENPTSEAQEKANQKRDIFELTVRLNENFKPNDFYLTFNYREKERPETTDEAKKDRTDLLRKLRRIYKKEGKELKFIISTEFGKEGGLHHHMVLNADVDIKKIKAVWKKGRVWAELLDDSGNYHSIASYMVKSRKQWKEHGGKGRMWTCSKNLRRPETKKRIIRANRYAKIPTPKKGYYIENVEEYITADGWPCQTYVLVKIEEGRAP